MPSKGLTRAEVNVLRDQLAALLHEVDEGRLEASVSMRHRIEGAVTALALVTDDVGAESSVVGGFP